MRRTGNARRKVVFLFPDYQLPTDYVCVFGKGILFRSRRYDKLTCALREIICAYFDTAVFACVVCNRYGVFISRLIFIFFFYVRCAVYNLIGKRQAHIKRIHVLFKDDVRQHISVCAKQILTDCVRAFAGCKIDFHAVTAFISVVTACDLIFCACADMVDIQFKRGRASIYYRVMEFHYGIFRQSGCIRGIETNDRTCRNSRAVRNNRTQYGIAVFQFYYDCFTCRRRCTTLRRTYVAERRISQSNMFGNIARN